LVCLCQCSLTTAPSGAANIRLIGALLLEQQEEWQLDGRRVFSEQSMAKLDSSSEPGQDQQIAALAAAALRLISDQVPGLGIYTCDHRVTPAARS
jgi:hypothetical protein